MVHMSLQDSEGGPIGVVAPTMLAPIGDLPSLSIPMDQVPIGQVMRANVPNRMGRCTLVPVLPL